MIFYKNHKCLFNFIVFVAFVLMAMIFNWSILLGENLMKWDIWDAEYPLQVMMSDAISQGTIPLWNPLMQFGTPEYAIVGSPIWYPITLLLAWIGYTPQVLAFSYIIHIAIGSFGMYLLVKQELVGKNEMSGPAILSSVICGALYGCSGMYLSNAEHIMIIISISWVPYVFFYTRKYIALEKTVYAMLAGGCAGLILLGGYPEVFYNTFLFLIVYVVFFVINKNESKKHKIWRILKSYVAICIYTIMASAITLIPFLFNKGLITRGTGMGQVPLTTSLVSLASLLFSGFSNIVTDSEISMIDYYIGIIVILLIPQILHSKIKNRGLYGIFTIGAFLLCISTNSFLHTFLYRFFPMYDSFRFPQVNRVFLHFSILMVVSSTIKELLEMKLQIEVVKFTKRLMQGILLLIGILFLATYLFEVGNIEKQKLLIKSATLTLFIIAIYYVIFKLINNGTVSRRKLQLAVCMAILIETATFYLVETPISIAMYNPIEYSYNEAVRDYVDDQLQYNKTRNRNVNFAEQPRSTSRYNSQEIVFNKTFDEEGYLSFILAAQKEFKDTYCRSIIEQNPVIYFTDDVVSSDTVDIQTWINSPDTKGEQIYVDNEKTNNGKAETVLKAEVIDRRELSTQLLSDGIYVESEFMGRISPTTRLRLYFDKNGNYPLELTFYYNNNEDCDVYTGEFATNLDEYGYYIDIFYPDLDVTYSGVQIIANQNMTPKCVQLITTERMTGDSYTNVSLFGFNTINMNVEAPNDGYITILQSYHKGWNAYVDGEKVAIETVDGCFMGIKVPEGTHEVEMKFRPVDFFIGAGISGIYFIGVVCLWINMLITRKIKNRKDNKDEG